MLAAENVDPARAFGTILRAIQREDEMDNTRWDKLAAAGGIIGVALFIVAIIVYGSAPSADDDAQAVAAFFSDNRSRVLWSVVLSGLGLLAFVWFIAALVQTMRDAGEGRLASAAFASFLLGYSIGAVAALDRATLAFSVADARPDLVLPLYHLSLVIDVVGGLLVAGLYTAVAGATFRTGLFPRWWAWISAVAAVWAVVNATAWNRDGFWSPTGGGAFIGFNVFFVWMLVTSILLVRRTGRQSPAS